MSVKSLLAFSKISSALFPLIRSSLVIVTKFVIFSLIKSKSGLSTTGMYAIIRHPIYSGTIILYFGLVLFQESIIPLMYFPISIVLYFLMTVFEEKDLIRSFGDEYIEYKKKVKKRIIPYVL